MNDIAGVPHVIPNERLPLFLSYC